MTAALPRQACDAIAMIAATPAVGATRPAFAACAKEASS
jgi:hypothetical protein